MRAHARAHTHTHSHSLTHLGGDWRRKHQCRLITISIIGFECRWGRARRPLGTLSLPKLLSSRVESGYIVVVLATCSDARHSERSGVKHTALMMDMCAPRPRVRHGQDEGATANEEKVGFVVLGIAREEQSLVMALTTSPGHGRSLVGITIRREPRIC